jgi:hypothetical protein
VLPDLWQEQLIQQARAEVATPIATQSANGTVLDQTLWYYNFNFDRPGELHGSGMFQLDRIARRHKDQCSGCPLRLYLQRSQERAIGVKPAELAARRAETDQQHYQAVVEYMAAFWSDVPYTLVVFDPPPQGINGRDALNSFNGMQATALGYIPVGFRVEAATSRTGGSSGGVFFQTPPVVSDVTATTPSALGVNTISSGAAEPGPPP